MNTEQGTADEKPWQRNGNCIYQLQHDGWKKGVEQFRNRFSIWVQNDSGAMKPEEIEAISRRVEAIPDLERELIANREILIDLRDNHLNHAAAVVRALVQKRIEAADRALSKAKGATP